jgi:CAAX protease family protein
MQSPTVNPSKDVDGAYLYFALACAITWLLAAPTAFAWMHHEPPSALAMAASGLSAFGPTFAALAIAAPRKQLGEVFGRWRTHPLLVLFALLAPLAIHLVATAIDVGLGGHPDRWFHPPSTPERLAALVVFPLGEEFGWRGFAHPRIVAKHGLAKGSLILGAVWGIWHLMYAITPDAAGFDVFEFGLTMVELPLYSLLVAWAFERSNRSMAVAIAFHAGAHLDHIELAPRDHLGLYACHLAVLVVLALLAYASFSKLPSTERLRSA